MKKVIVLSLVISFVLCSCGGNQEMLKLEKCCLDYTLSYED